MSIISSLLRLNGIRYVSDDEKEEARRIGAKKAKEIYEPIFDSVVESYKILEDISKREKENYEIKKMELITKFTELKSRNDLLKRRCDDAGFKTVFEGTNMTSSLGMIGGVGLSFLCPVGKESVPAYQKAKEAGFEKTKKIFEKKLENMQKIRNKLLEDIAEFDIMKDKTFAEAAKRIAEEEMRGQYYRLLLKVE